MCEAGNAQSQIEHAGLEVPVQVHAHTGTGDSTDNATDKIPNARNRGPYGSPSHSAGSGQDR